MFQTKHVELILEAFPDAELAGWKGPGWYFWDEVGQYCYGPYPLEDEALEHLENYCYQL